MKARPYQDKAKEEFHWIIKKKRTSVSLGLANTKMLLSLPCGGGKTFTATSYAKECIEKDTHSAVFWGVHRKELRDQAVKAFEAIGVTPSVWDADNKPKTFGKYNVVMIPSSKTIPPDRFNKAVDKPPLLIIDEAHHKNATTWQRFEKSIPEPDILYLTATPDENTLDSVDWSYKVTIDELVADGFLAKPKYERVATELSFDLAMRGGDFTQKSLDKLNTPERNKIIFKRWQKFKNQYGKTMIFVANKKAAESLAKVFRTKKVKTYVIFGDSKTRDNDIKEFSDAPTDSETILISVNVFVEGTDVPSVKTVFICRPTLSTVLYVQMIGRGSRITEHKRDYYIVDFVDAISKYVKRSVQMAREALGENNLPQEILEEVQLDEIKKYVNKNVTKKFSDIDIVDLPDVIGHISYSNRYIQKTTAVLLSSDVEALYATFQHLYQICITNGGFKEEVDATYGKVGINTNLNYSQWKHICWGMFQNFRNNGSEANMSGFKMHFMSNKHKPNTALLRGYDQVCEITAETNEEYNSTWQGKESFLWEEMLKEMRWSNPDYFPLSTSTPQDPFKDITPIGYKNRVLTVKVSNDWKRKIKPKTKFTACLPNIRQLKQVLVKALRSATDDHKAEISFRFKD